MKSRENTQPMWTKEFILLALSNFFMFTSFYMLLPTLPIFVVKVLKGSVDQVGLIIGFFTTAQIFSRPLAGRWLDTIGRKKIFLWSRLLFLIIMIGYLGMKGLLLFFILRFLHGFSFGMATTASGTMVADLIPNERRAEGLGYYSGFASMAMVVGPTLGLWAIHLSNFSMMFILCSTLAALSVLLGSLIQYNEPTKNASTNTTRSFSWRQFIEPNAVFISIISMLLLALYGGIVSFISLYAQDLGMATIAGYFFSVYSLSILVARPITGKIADKYGASYVIYPGMIGCILGIILLSQAHSMIAFLLAGLLIGLGFGAIQPSLHAKVIQSVPSERRGAATATYFISADLGIASGAFVLGFIANAIGYRGMFLSTTLLILLGLLLYWVYSRMNARKTEEAPSQEASAG
ncbi:MFS transporter [Marininema halotolerans]|uniref:Predicted arabinose efflux permease, MFS family n=1 Tax=Marininema halotolerans TaxID=1155944 RepID=A0A1I6U2W1_9BACL|nr:MFS transporter [Marininema halotolerans]SFS95607.1 Predicted arabinose efflux permease, MFS family [Marininema halotolerans]